MKVPGLRTPSAVLANKCTLALVFITATGKVANAMEKVSCSTTTRMFILAHGCAAKKKVAALSFSSRQSKSLLEIGAKVQWSLESGPIPTAHHSLALSTTTSPRVKVNGALLMATRLKVVTSKLCALMLMTTSSAGRLLAISLLEKKEKFLLFLLFVYIPFAIAQIILHYISKMKKNTQII
jgi:hypothetical protein